MWAHPESPTVPPQPRRLGAIGPCHRPAHSGSDTNQTTAVCQFGIAAGPSMALWRHAGLAYGFSSVISPAIPCSRSLLATPNERERMSPSLAIDRRSVDAAPMITLFAAGRQPLFFFGALMDLDVLAYLLERPVDLDDLQPATIAGFRRVRAAGASYPVLVPEAGGKVEGRLLRRAN